MHLVRISHGLRLSAVLHEQRPTYDTLLKELTLTAATSADDRLVGMGLLAS